MIESEKIYFKKHVSDVLTKIYDSRPFLLGIYTVLCQEFDLPVQNNQLVKNIKTSTPMAAFRLVVSVAFRLVEVVVASHYCDYQEESHQNHHQDHQNHHQDHHQGKIGSFRLVQNTVENSSYCVL